MSRLSAEVLRLSASCSTLSCSSASILFDSSSFSSDADDETTIPATAAAPTAATPTFAAVPVPPGRRTGCPEFLVGAVDVLLRLAAVAVDGRCEVVLVVDIFPDFGAGGGLDAVVDLTIVDSLLLSRTNFLPLIVEEDEVATLCSITLRLVASLADLGGVAGCGEPVPGVPALDFDNAVLPVRLAPIPYLLLLLDFLIAGPPEVSLAGAGVLVLVTISSEGEIFLVSDSTLGLVEVVVDTCVFDFDRDLVVVVRVFIPESTRLREDADFLTSSVTLLSFTSFVAVEDEVI